MEIPITKFRRELFEVVNQAMSGVDVFVTHKGRKFRIVPDGAPMSRLSRITPLEILNPVSSEADELAMKREMQDAWEEDWAKL